MMTQIDSKVMVTVMCVMTVEYVGVLAAVVADLVSGIRKSRREGRECRSRGLRRTVSKLSSYYLALFCLSVIDVMVIASVVALQSLGKPTVEPFPYLTSVGAISLAMIEAKSIVENSPHSLRLLDALDLLRKLRK